MSTIDRTSRLAVEFTLSWSSGTMTHLERYYADPVSVWRDVLPDGLSATLLGKSPGARAEVAIPAARFHAPRDERRVVRVRPAQFQGRDSAGRARGGRYYPQGLLHGVGGVYSQPTSSCRFLMAGRAMTQVDLNHPLAGDLHLRPRCRGASAAQGTRRLRGLARPDQCGGPGTQAPPADGVAGIFSIRRVSGATTTGRITSTSSRGWYSTWTVPGRAEIEHQYGRLIAPGAEVLDLKGSWTSHLPGVAAGRPDRARPEQRGTAPTRGPRPP